MAPKRKAPVPKKATKAKKARKESVVREPEPVDPVVEKTDAITDAISKHFEEDERVKELLLSSCSFCFQKPKEERHHYIDPLHNMVEETLKSFITRFTTNVKEAQEKITNSDKQKEENILSRDQYTAALEQNKASITEQTTVNKELESKVDQTSEELRAKEEECSEAVAAGKRMQKDVGDTEEVYESYKQIRDHSAEVSAKDKKKQLAILQKFLTKSGAPTSLIPSAAVILMKDEHVEFDLVVLKEINRVFDERLCNLRESIAKERAQAEPQLKASELAQEAHDLAEKEYQKGEEALKELKTKGKEIKSSLNKVEKELKDHDSNLERIQEELSEFEGELANLKEVYQGFEFLRDRSNQVTAEEEKSIEDAYFDQSIKEKMEGIECAYNEAEDVQMVNGVHEADAVMQVM